MSKVDLYAAIRRDARAGLSSRALESKYRVGRRTVTSALASAWPKPRKSLPPRASKLDPFKPLVDEILRAEREEKNSVAIASNESFSGWTKTFTDPRLCAAIVDRLTFGGNIIETGTDSYRLAQTRARAEREGVNAAAR
jgi:transposase